MNRAWKLVGDQIANDRILVFAKHTKRWEIAHREDVGGRAQWVRDDMSTICWAGEEIARAALPAKPKAANP